MRHLLFSFFAIFCFVFASCHNDDNNGIPSTFTPFAKSDTCFTAMVKMASNDVNRGVRLVFDIDEKTCGKELLFLDTKHDAITTYRWVYNTNVLPKDITNEDKIKFKILAYKIGPFYDQVPELANHQTQCFIIKMCE